MEVGTEISQKIRSAIKAKLLELGAYVDDELPDYIMVMVANKKSHSQMNSDLGLFLGTNTETFTEWLHTLLGKLQTIRIDSDKASDKSDKSKDGKDKKKVSKDRSPKHDSAKGKDKERKKTRKHSSDSSAKKMPVSSESAAVGHKESHATSDEKEHSQSADAEEVRRKSAEESVPENSLVKRKDMSSRSKGSQEDIEDVRQLLVTETHSDELAEELETTEAEVVNSQVVKDTSKVDGSSKKSDSSTSQSVACSEADQRTVQASNLSRKRKVPSSVVANVSRQEDKEEEYDPYNPSVGSVASVVKVTSRKSSVPPSLQANRNVENEKRKDTDAEETQGQCEELPAKRFKPNDSAVCIEDIKQALVEALEKSRMKDDNVAHFCRMVESSLRKLPSQKLALAKLRIQKVLFELESTTAGPQTETEGHEDLKDNIISVQTMESTSNFLEVTDMPKTVDYTSVATTSSLVVQAVWQKSDQGDQSDSKNNHCLDQIGNLDSDHTANILVQESPADRIIFRGRSKPEQLVVKSLESHETISSRSKTVSINAKGSEGDKRLSGKTQDEPIAQSPVSSSKLDASSPSSVHSCPPSSTSGLDLRRCIVSTSSKSRESTLSPTDSKLKSLSLHNKAKSSTAKTKCMPSILVDSIHNKKRSETETASVLKQSRSKDRSPRGAHPSDNDESIDSPRQYSTEALKVMAKNLKVTVINKRALNSQQGSTSDDSSSDDSDDEEDTSDDEEDEDNKSSEEDQKEPVTEENKLKESLS